MPGTSPFPPVNPSRKSIIFSSAVFSVNDFLIGDRNWTKAVSVDWGVFRYFPYCSNSLIVLYIKKGNTFFFSAPDDRCRSCTDINLSEDGRAVTLGQKFLIAVGCQTG